MTNSASPTASAGPAAATPKRRLGGTFMAGAAGRLLPASIPLRWFGAAVVFHAFTWLALALAAPGWAQWHGGLGWPLAALHAVTLGTLVASAVGASLQLLPVATRQPVRWPALPALLWWLFVPALALLLLGMGLARPGWLGIGAAGVIAVLLAWGVLLALNLRGARGMPGVQLHGWVALAALVLLAASASALVMLWLGRPWLARDSALALHLAAGVFGLMSMLAFGLATILLPMFALASVPPERWQIAGGAAGAAALALAALAAFVPAASLAALALRALALAAAAAALVLHVVTMRRVLAQGMRSNLGRAGRLMRIGWLGAALALLLAAARLVLDTPALRDPSGSGAPPALASTLGELFVLAAVGGWLLSFLLGVLQRILPFLVSMHAGLAGRTSRSGGARAPMPSALNTETALAWHERGHVAALLLLMLAVVDRERPWLLAAAACGGAGALCFGVFFAMLGWRLRASRRAAAGSDERA